MPRSRSRRDPVEAMTRGYGLKERLSKRSLAGAAPALPQDIYTPQEIMDAVSAMNADGGAILFGVTSDGGVLTVILYLGDYREASYIRYREEWLELLAEILGSSPTPIMGGGDGSSS